MKWDNLQVLAAEVPASEVGAVVSHPIAWDVDTDTRFVLDDVDQANPEPRVRISADHLAGVLESGEWIRVHPAPRARRYHLALVFTPRIHQLLEQAGALNVPSRPREIISLGGFYFAYQDRHQMRAWLEGAADCVITGARRAANDAEREIPEWQEDRLTAALSKQREVVRDAVYLTARRSSQRRLVYVTLAYLDAKLGYDTTALAEQVRAEFGEDLHDAVENEIQAQPTGCGPAPFFRWDVSSERLPVPP